MKIHHIGIACKNINKAIKAYSSMYNVVGVSEIVHDDLQNADLCILKTDNGLDVEFISGEQVASLLKSRINYYHLCYSTECIEQEIARFEEKGCVVVSDLKPAILFGGKRVAFLMTPTGLIELVEE